MGIAITKPSVDVSGWESVVIHLSAGAYGDVTAENIEELINKDIAKTAKQKSQSAVDSQEKYDNKYIKALFNRMKKYLDFIAQGTQEVECVIDGANSNFSADIGTGSAQGNLNNLEDLDKLLRDGMGENILRKLLDDVLASDDDLSLHSNMTIHELKQNGVEDMIDNMRASSVMRCYDEWNGGEDCQMDNAWWQPYTERILKMAMILHEIVTDYLSIKPNFDPDNLWAALDSSDLTFNIAFEYDNSMDEIIRTRGNLVDFVKTFYDNYG